MHNRRRCNEILRTVESYRVYNKFTWNINLGGLIHCRGSVSRWRPGEEFSGRIPFVVRRKHEMCIFRRTIFQISPFVMENCFEKWEITQSIVKFWIYTTIGAPLWKPQRNFNLYWKCKDPQVARNIGVSRKWELWISECCTARNSARVEVRHQMWLQCVTPRCLKRESRAPPFDRDPGVCQILKGRVKSFQPCSTARAPHGCASLYVS